MLCCDLNLQGMRLVGLRARLRGNHEGRCGEASSLCIAAATAACRRLLVAQELTWRCVGVCCVVTACWACAWWAHVRDCAGPMREGAGKLPRCALQQPQQHVGDYW